MPDHEQQIQDILEKAETNGRNIVLGENSEIKVGREKIYPMRRGIKPTPSQMRILEDAILNPEKVKGVVTIKDSDKEVAYKVQKGEVVTPWHDKSLTPEQQAIWNEQTKPKEPAQDLKQQYTDLLNKSFKDNGLDTEVSYSEIKEIAKRSPALARNLDAQVLASAKASGMEPARIDNVLSASPTKEASIEAVKSHLEKIRSSSPGYGFKDVMANNQSAITANAKTTIAKVATAQKNLEKLGQKVKDFSLKNWAQTQATSFGAKVEQYVSKQVQGVKDWAVSQYPKMREAVLSPAKKLDDRLMNAASNVKAANGIQSADIEKSAGTILHLATAGQPEKGFSNDKVSISMQGKGISIDAGGKNIYSDGQISKGATTQDKALLAKLPEKAQEMSMKTFQAMSAVKQVAEIER
jgi:hypothetical protein